MADMVLWIFKMVVDLVGSGKDVEAVWGCIGRCGGRRIDDTVLYRLTCSSLTAFDRLVLLTSGFLDCNSFIDNLYEESSFIRVCACLDFYPDF
jgi:hypothetical protein